jgi:hypothetical protein
MPPWSPSTTRRAVRVVRPHQPFRESIDTVGHPVKLPLATSIRTVLPSMSNSAASRSVTWPGRLKATSQSCFLAVTSPSCRNHNASVMVSTVLRRGGTFVVGANASCAAELENTSDGCGTWVSANTVGSALFRHPTDPGAVRAPGPSTSQPWGKRAVLDLAVLSTYSARGLCADGLVRSTKETGSSPQRRPVRPGPTWVRSPERWPWLCRRPIRDGPTWAAWMPAARAFDPAGRPASRHLLHPSGWLTVGDHDAVDRRPPQVSRFLRESCAAEPGPGGPDLRELSRRRRHRG